MTSFGVRSLDASTWADFARLVEEHNGVWRGCWCMAFHSEAADRGRTAALNRSEKECRVREGRAHAALVYDGETCVGWCQFGPTDELPRIKHQRAYREGLSDLPDWRITCFFVDRERRREGIAKAALAGALRMIAAKGGGTVDGYPIAVRGKYSSSFLWGGTESMFAEVGFRRVGRLGTSKLVMRKRVRGR